LNRSKNKRGALLSKIEAKSSHPLSLSNWQRKKVQKLSAQELGKKGMAWIPKGSIQTQDMGNDQAKGETQLKEKKIEICTKSSELLVITQFIYFTNAAYAYVLELILRYA
jgi:hypothetical protein